MRRALDRLRVILLAATVLLSLALLAVVVGGVLLRPIPPEPYPAMSGRALVMQRGTGASGGSRGVLSESRHAVGIGVRCDGYGPIRVTLEGIGVATSDCRQGDTTDGGYVLSGFPATRVRWHLITAPGNRWALVLTRPVADGAVLAP